LIEFSISDTPIQGLKVVERKRIEDRRGSLSRIFCASQLEIAGWRIPISQVNHTVTKSRGTVRGLHFQHKPFAEIKLISCLRGKVWDVAVDLRKDSPTFLQWHSEELSSENHRALLIPEGFAHGFQTMSDDCELLYMHSTPYRIEAEAGIHPNDPILQILWPLEFYEISERDVSHPFLNNQFEGIL
jgi:dTDP-4-dehydrorhamnose 3,5-epimerase